MYIPPFEYFAPANLAEALELKRTHGRAIDVLAGGTDLLVQVKSSGRKVERMLSLKHLSELRTISVTGGQITIGAGVTFGELERSQLPETNPVFADMLSTLAGPQIRNRATMGGNICAAAACADSPPALLVNNAEVTVASSSGSKTLPLKEFITGPRELALADDEMLVSITCDLENSGSAYIKFGPRKAQNISIVGLAGALKLDSDTITELKVAVTAASPAPVFVDGADLQLIGQTYSRETADSVAESVVSRLNPISDVRGSAEYRLRLARVGVIRALERSYARLRGGSDA